MPTFFTDFLSWILKLPEAQAASALAVAAFTGLLLLVAWRQNRDSRVQQRAYVSVKPAGILLMDDRGELLSHVLFHNAGHLPATKVRWKLFIEVDTNDERSWFNLEGNQFVGNNVIPPGGEIRMGSPAIGLQRVLDARESSGPNCFLYVWGTVHYDDGYGNARETDFCHRYNYRATPRLPGDRPLYVLPAEVGRSHPHGNRAT